MRRRLLGESKQYLITIEINKGIEYVKVIINGTTYTYYNNISFYVKKGTTFSWSYREEGESTDTTGSNSFEVTEDYTISPTESPTYKVTVQVNPHIDYINYWVNSRTDSNLTKCSSTQVFDGYKKYTQIYWEAVLPSNSAFIFDGAMEPFAKNAGDATINSSVVISPTATSTPFEFWVLTHPSNPDLPRCMLEIELPKRNYEICGSNTYKIKVKYYFRITERDTDNSTYSDEFISDEFTFKADEPDETANLDMKTEYRFWRFALPSDWWESGYTYYGFFRGIVSATKV